jgi:hypothetical protein
MEAKREPYRKLPGRRRGFLFGSSVWLGSDHLLLVKSSRFREEYKRFYFRDIQAIVTAKAPRFHISTRSAVIAVVWFAICLSLAGRGVLPGNALDWGSAAVAVALIAAWAYISAARSCRCRIYTAVSSDELPSVYRTWTARRFLNRVQPHLDQAQGVLEGNWAEAVEERQIGPLPEGRIGLAMPGTAPSMPLSQPSAKPARTPVSYLFVGSLCLGGLAELLSLRAAANVGRWILLGFLLMQLTAAVTVLVQHFTGKLRASLRNLAIVALASIGVWYYAVQMGAGIPMGYQNAKRGNRAPVATQLQPLGLLDYPLSRELAGGMNLLLGVAGLVLLFSEERQPDKRVSFNV